MTQRLLYCMVNSAVHCDTHNHMEPPAEFQWEFHRFFPIYLPTRNPTRPHAKLLPTTVKATFRLICSYSA